MYCIVLYCTTLRIKIMDQSQSSVYHPGSKEGSDLEEVSEGGGSGEAPIICPCGTQQSFMGFFVGNFSLQPLHKNHVAQKLPPISDYDDNPPPPPTKYQKEPSCISPPHDSSFHTELNDIFVIWQTPVPGPSSSRGGRLSIFGANSTVIVNPDQVSDKGTVEVPKLTHNHKQIRNKNLST